jgi:hypothetical protein
MSFNISFDYRFDTAGFFNDPARGAALEEAARLWEVILKDEFEDIPAGTSFTITNPTDGVTKETITLTSSIDDLLVFVGARSIPGSTLAQASPSDGGSATDFEPSVGTIVFDTDSDWNFSLAGPSESSSDFLSTAMHEIGHILGFGTSAAFTAFNQAGSFVGPNTLNANNSQGVPLTASEHVQDGFRNDMVLMDPTSKDGTRQLPTDIDKAILADIGWEIDGFTKQGSTTIIGTASGETLFGSLKGEEMNGAGGNDTVQGDAGNDILRGGAGNDVLFGQQGRDTFALALGDGQNDAADFDVSNEVIRLIDSGFNSVAEALAAVSKPFSNVSRITLSDGSYMQVFHNVQSGTPLTAANIELTSANTPTDVPSTGDNVLLGTAGNDSLDGGLGQDTAIYSGFRSDYVVLTASTGKTIVVDSVAGRDGKDSLQNVENIRFGTEALTLAAALVEPADADNSAFQVYRFYNTETGSHFFTTSIAERNSVVETLDVLSFEGNAFDSNVTEANGTAVFRFYNKDNGVHFYTAAAEEAASLRLNAGFLDEGISYYAANDDSNGGTALYRFYNTQNDSHFYTVSEAERDNIINTIGHYKYEDVAFYVDAA